MMVQQLFNGVLLGATFCLIALGFKLVVGVRAGMVHVPEGRRVLPRLTVEENLRLGGFTQRRRSSVAAAMDDVFTRFSRLRDRRQQKSGTLSGGEQQKRVIGRALMARPKLLLLDEPSLGLSPLLVAEVFELVAGFARDGVTLMLVEQNVSQGLKVAGCGYVLATGQIKASGSAAQLLANPSMLRSYLGGKDSS